MTSSGGFAQLYHASPAASKFSSSATLCIHQNQAGPALRRAFSGSAWAAGGGEALGDSTRDRCDRSDESPSLISITLGRFGRFHRLPASDGEPTTALFPVGRLAYRSP